MCVGLSLRRVGDISISPYLASKGKLPRNSKVADHVVGEWSRYAPPLTPLPSPRARSRSVRPVRTTPSAPPRWSSHISGGGGFSVQKRDEHWGETPLQNLREL